METFYSFINCFFTLLFFNFIWKFNREPSVCGSTRELLWLCVGTIGFFFTGPCQALIPIQSLINYHWMAWIAASCLYFLTVWLIGRWFLGTHYSIEVYQVCPLQARQLFNRLALSLDPGAEFAGDTAVLPALNATLELKLFSLFSHATIKVHGQGRSSVMKKNPMVQLKDFLKGTPRASHFIYWTWLIFFLANLFYLAVSVTQNYGTLMGGLVHYLLT